MGELLATVVEFRSVTPSPEISVVMGVYNNADALPAALESVLSQEGVELEFIVVNDGSTDGTAAILDEAARQDARL
ncbi:MAG: glycosyltransferase, partial [Kiritimatiellia bacterium]